MLAATKDTEARPEGPLYGSPADLMRRYGFGRTKTYELIWSGELPSVRVGRSILVPFAAVDEYLARQASAAKPAFA